MTIPISYHWLALGLAGLLIIDRAEGQGVRESLPVDQADAFIRHVFQNGEDTRFLEAADAYLSILERAGEPLSPADRALVSRHVAQMAFLLPDALRSQTIEDAKAVERGDGGLDDEAGAMLVAWWRSQDPRPATSWNERIVEHLGRVATAEARYPYDGSLAGFDDRGVIYVRLGEPSSIGPLRYDLMNARSPLADSRKMMALTNEMPEAVFQPRNEFWRYDGIQDYGHFIFVWREGRYRLSDVRELLADVLKRGYSNSTRGRLRSELAIWALHDLYGQLLPVSRAYTMRYLEIDHYINKRDEGVPNLQPTYIFATGFAFRERREDRQLRSERDLVVPGILSETYDERLSLPVELRLARFLEADGTTRTDVYWAIPAHALAPSLGTQLEIFRKGYRLANSHTLHVNAVQSDPDYRPRKKTRRRYEIRESYTPERTAIPVHVTSVAGDTGAYHLALQWDQYMLIDETANPPDYAYIRTGVYRADSLRALNSDPGVLELSDLVPILASSLNEAGPIRDDEGVILRAYPFDTITPETELALYFEAYHLALGGDDHNHFTVAYEIARMERRGGLAGMLRQKKAEITSAATSYTSQSTTAREHILLDLEEWEGEGSLSITVRVTDDVTGQQAERTMELKLEDELLPAEGRESTSSRN